MHSPEHAAEVAEGRKLGGLRRRREITLAGAYDFVGLHSPAEIQRLLEIAVFDTLALENSIQRSRTIAQLAHVGIQLLEADSMEERLQAVELALGPRLGHKRR
jgi:hypothetical protein